MRLALPLLLALPSVSSAANTSPTEVFWYYGNNGSLPDPSFEVFIQSQTVGVEPGSLTSTNVWPETLAEWDDFRYVILGRPQAAFSDDQIADLQAFLDNHGILVIAGDDATVGPQHIENTNLLLDALNLEMNLVYPTDDLGESVPDAAYIPPTVPPALGPTCTPIPLVAGRIDPLLTTDPSTLGMGNIHVSGITNVTEASQTFTIDNSTYQFRIAVTNGLTLLTSDFALFSDETCGQAGRLSLWENLWERYCDRDGDQAIASVCGGFDCDDNDPDVGNTFTYIDADGDGYGDTNLPSCDEGAVADGTDCDDSDPDRNPDQEETCDGIDNDCDNLIDALDPDATGLIAYYQDSDEDGYGRAGTTPRNECEPPDDGVYVDNNLDCTDNNAQVHPDATEICNNGIDDNCDGQEDETCVTPPPISPPAPTDTDPGPCGCQTNAPVASWVGLGLMGLFARRRRSS